MKKVANYNVRFCDVVSVSPKEIDLTPAELKEGLGKIVYIIRDVYESQGVKNLVFSYLVSAEFSEDGNVVRFVIDNGSGLDVVSFRSTDVNTNYKIGII